MVVERLRDDVDAALTQLCDEPSEDESPAEAELIGSDCPDDGAADVVHVPEDPSTSSEDSDDAPLMRLLPGPRPAVRAPEDKPGASVPEDKPGARVPEDKPGAYVMMALQVEPAAGGNRGEAVPSAVAAGNALHAPDGAHGGEIAPAPGAPDHVEAPVKRPRLYKEQMQCPLCSNSVSRAMLARHQRSVRCRNNRT